MTAMRDDPVRTRPDPFAAGVFRRHTTWVSPVTHGRSSGDLRHRHRPEALRSRTGRKHRSFGEAPARTTLSTPPKPSRQTRPGAIRAVETSQKKRSAPPSFEQHIPCCSPRGPDPSAARPRLVAVLSGHITSPCSSSRADTVRSGACVCACVFQRRQGPSVTGRPMAKRSHKNKAKPNLPKPARNWSKPVKVESKLTTRIWRKETRTWSR